MKIRAIILFVILAVLTSGCTGTTASGTAPTLAALPVTPGPAAAPALPDLTGTWTGPTQGYDEGTGFTDYPGLSLALNVTEQHGRLFSGRVEFTMNGTRSSLPVAGVISRDGTTFSMVEKGAGYSTGVVLAKNEIELTYMDDNTPFSAAIDTLKRV
jgi:hypothetical protein